MNEKVENGVVTTDVLKQISRLRQERGWSEYQLAERSGVPQSTISSWYRKNMTPSLSSLEKICDAFGLSLSRFFDDGTDAVYLTFPQRELLKKWDMLSEAQKTALVSLIDAILP